MNYILNTLEQLLNISSPTGNASDAIEFVNDRFKELNISTSLTNKGGLIGTISGEDRSKSITLSAHVDTLGAMVKEIKSNGRIKLSKIGGYSWNSVEGENVEITSLKGDVFTGTIMTTKPSVHVHGGEALDSIKRNDENMEVRIDELVENKEDVLELGINVGDFVSFDPRVSITENGFIKSRHLDDKAGVVSLLGIAKKLVEENITPKLDINFLISNYEEVGHGAANIPKNTVEFIAVDMAAPGSGQTSSEQSVTICAKDSSGPYDFDFRKKLVSIAEENFIDYKIDIYPFYGSDASAALRAGNDIRTALIGPGVDASHSFERTHIDAIVNTIELGYLYITK